MMKKYAERVLIGFSPTTMRKLQALREEGYTITGFIRAAVERALIEKEKS